MYLADYENGGNVEARFARLAVEKQQCAYTEDWLCGEIANYK